MAGFSYHVYNTIDNEVWPSGKIFLMLQPDDAVVDEFTITVGETGAKVITGLGFQPDVILLMKGGHFSGVTHGFCFGAASDTVQFTGVGAIRQGWAENGPYGVEGSRCGWSEDYCLGHLAADTWVLEVERTSLDADGFTLNIVTNLEINDRRVAFLALRGNFQLGVIDAGETSISGVPFAPEGVWFSSTKHQLVTDDPRRVGWDWMNGMASIDDMNCKWGGARYPFPGYRSTSRWDTDRAISLNNAATMPALADASIASRAFVDSWNAGGITLDWTEDDGNPYRIGYLLAAPAEALDFYEHVPATPTTKTVETRIEPLALIGTTTGYLFSGSDATYPQDEFVIGGSGYLSFGAAPWGVLTRDEVMTGAFQTWAPQVAYVESTSNSQPSWTRELGGWGRGGATITPPRDHIDIFESIPELRIVGMNWRYADRRGHNIRGLWNPDDV